MLEQLIKPKNAEKHPFTMFFVGAVYALAGILIAFFVFPENRGLMSVFITVLCATQLMYNTLKREEKKDILLDKEKNRLKAHFKALDFMLYFFIGATLVYSLFYIVLPPESREDFLKEQINAVTHANSITGNLISQTNVFFKILINNLKVLIFSLLLSIVLGAGAVYVLIWNASVIGVALGKFFLEQITYQNYFIAVPFSIARYAIHGIPEVIAYFVVFMAGGIISTAAIHKNTQKQFLNVLLDTADLIIISVLILVIAAFLEVYVTPSIY